MKKFLFLQLTALLCLFTLSLLACSPDDDGNTDPPPPAENILALLQNSEVRFQVVRPDTATVDATGKIAVNLNRALTEALGVSTTIVTDYTGEYGAPEMECEILVGKTNRPQSAAAEEKRGDNDYCICVIDQKLCIVGDGTRNLERAVDIFLNTYLQQEQNVFYVAKSLNFVGNFEIPDGAYLIVPGASGSGAVKYDESVAIACLQGIINRESDNKVYLNTNTETEDWLETMRAEGRWLENQAFVELDNFAELLSFGKKYLKKVVIWDPAVPATLNVACTIAGVEDGIVMTQSYYEKHQAALDDLAVVNLVGMFDGSVTGSAKNDAYRWAIEHYLETGLCSTDYICSYIDGWSHRASGDTSYTVVRDWGIYHRAFVYDLSPWNDEAPLDDLDQPLGTDKETLQMILGIMREMTEDNAPYEVCGFFEHQKYSQAGKNEASSHSSVHTEWEYAAIMTPFNGYHNTCIDNAFNESFHSLYDGAQELTNNRPDEYLTLEEDKIYLCLFMGDYDSTHPVYRYLKQAWDDPRRGDLPFAWAINPNMLDTYPDLIEYYYDTKTDNDYFVSDASAAGYFMPSQVPDELWDNFLAHNIAYFERADMSIAPMVLDRAGLSQKELEKLVQFAPDGIAEVIHDRTYLYEDTAVAALLGGGYDRKNAKVGAQNLEKVINEQMKKQNHKSGSTFIMLRCVWTTPTVMCQTVELYQEANPDKEIVVVDIYNYFNLLRQELEQ